MSYSPVRPGKDVSWKRPRRVLPTLQRRTYEHFRDYSLARVLLNGTSAANDGTLLTHTGVSSRDQEQPIGGLAISLVKGMRHT